MTWDCAQNANREKILAHDNYEHGTVITLEQRQHIYGD